MSKYARRTDSSQLPIVKGLRAAGVFVEPRLSRVGSGVPDLLAIHSGRVYLLELKTPGRKRHESKARRVLQEGWRLAAKIGGGVEVPVVETLDDALRALGIEPGLGLGAT